MNPQLLAVIALLTGLTAYAVWHVLGAAIVRFFAGEADRFEAGIYDQHSDYTGE